MAPPFRAEQIGSLMRPPELLEARSAAGLASTYSQLTEDVKKMTKAAIADVAATQVKLGIRPITSGEYERDKFFSGLFETLQGMEVIKDIPLTEGYRTNFPTIRTLKALGITSRDSVVAVDRIVHTRSAYLSEWMTLRNLLPGR